jgi:hypothetical protein
MIIKRNTIKTILILTILVSITVYFASATPYGPTGLAVEDSERANFSVNSAKSTTAEAGNVTELQINTTQITRRWQGYYGNISGTITLEDASGNIFYDWSASGSEGFSPTGTIFAANDSSITWADVICVNFTANSSNNEGINKSLLETKYGMASNDADGISQTFDSVGNVSIGSRDLVNCPGTNVYTNSSQVTTRWNETLLTQNTTNSVIYASQVENNKYGFNNQTWDFQIMVGENNGALATYWFFVELT